MHSELNANCMDAHWNDWLIYKINRIVPLLVFAVHPIIFHWTELIVFAVSSSLLRLALSARNNKHIINDYLSITQSLLIYFFRKFSVCFFFVLKNHNSNVSMHSNSFHHVFCQFFFSFFRYIARSVHNSIRFVLKWIAQMRFHTHQIFICKINGITSVECWIYAKHLLTLRWPFFNFVLIIIMVLTF